MEDDMFRKAMYLAGAATLLVVGLASAQIPVAPKIQGAVQTQLQRKELARQLDAVRPKVEHLFVRLVPGKSQNVWEDNRRFTLQLINAARVEPLSALMETRETMDVYAGFTLELKADKTYAMDIEIWKRANGGAGDLVTNCTDGSHFRQHVSAHNMGVETPIHFTFQLHPQRDGFVTCSLQADPEAPTLAEYTFRAVSFREN
jgi:hypothetical protein